MTSKDGSNKNPIPISDSSINGLEQVARKKKKGALEDFAAYADEYKEENKQHLKQQLQNTNDQSQDNELSGGGADYENNPLLEIPKGMPINQINPDLDLGDPLLKSSEAKNLSKDALRDRLKNQNKLKEQLKARPANQPKMQPRMQPKYRSTPMPRPPGM